MTRRRPPGSTGFAAVLDRVKQEHEQALAAFAATGGDRILGAD